MLETPTITRTEARHAAVIHVTVPRDRIQSVMGPTVGELMQAVSEQGLAPSGPIFEHHLGTNADTFDFELGVPLDTAAAPAGRVKPVELPEVKVARAVHRGGYEGLGAAWRELDRWIAEEGLEPREDFWQRYLAGPESSSDPSTWRTELDRPLLDR